MRKNWTLSYKSPEDFIAAMQKDWDHYKLCHQTMYKPEKFAWGKYHEDPAVFFTSYKSYDEDQYKLFKSEYDKIAAFAPITTSNQFRKTRDVMGYKPSVPDFLNGNPKCMRRRKRQVTKHEPLTIWFSFSCIFSADDLDLMQQAAMVYKVMQLVKNYRQIKFKFYQGTEPDPKLTIDLSPNASMERFAKASSTAMRRGARWTWLYCKNGQFDNWDGGFPRWGARRGVNTLDHKRNMSYNMGIDVRQQDIVVPEGITMSAFKGQMHQWLMDVLPEYREMVNNKQSYVK